jgi:hypothetical protein
LFGRIHRIEKGRMVIGVSIIITVVQKLLELFQGCSGAYL